MNAEDLKDFEKLHFKSSDLQNLNFFLAWKDNPKIIEAFQRDISNFFFEELKQTISKYSKLPQNLIVDVVGRRGKGKSWLTLKIIEKYYELKEEKVDLKKILFFSNSQLINFLEENQDLEEVLLWKDERHEELGVDSVIAKVKLERFVDECRKKRINIFFVSPEPYFFKTDYTIVRIDWDLEKGISRNLVLGKEQISGLNSLPLGLLYASVPNEKLVNEYEKLKDEHLKKILKGEKKLDIDKYVLETIDYFDLWDKKKLGKEKFKALLVKIYPDLSYSMLEFCTEVYQLFMDGYLDLIEIGNEKKFLPRNKEMKT